MVGTVESVAGNKALKETEKTLTTHNKPIIPSVIL